MYSTSSFGAASVAGNVSPQSSRENSPGPYRKNIGSYSAFGAACAAGTHPFNHLRDIGTDPIKYIPKNSLNKRIGLATIGTTLGALGLAGLIKMWKNYQSNNKFNKNSQLARLH